MDDHTVRVREETLETLKGYKEKYNLSYNDIIEMALKNFENADLTPFLVDAPVYQIKVNLSRAKINDNVKHLLSKGHDLFIPDISPRQAMYIKRTLKKMGFVCDHAKCESDGKSGFLFSQHNHNNGKPVIESTKNVKAITNI